MLTRKTNPQGVDKVIDEMQVKLYAGLTQFFTSGITYKCYPRAYRNQTGDGYAAEVYTGNGEYTNAFLDDTVACQSFFGMGESSEIAEQSEASLHLVFFVNLEKAVNAAGQRMDEEVRIKVLEILGAGSYGSEVESVETGVERTLKEYKATRLRFSDHQPWHLFRVNLSVKYETKLDGCTPMSSL